mgnify:CR=1 FL=1
MLSSNNSNALQKQQVTKMSTIISYSEELEMPSILIHAPSARTVISNTDIVKHLIQIDGDAEKPFIFRVRFFNCIIIAENLRAFDTCYFDESCTMTVKNMPVVNEHISINCNYAPQLPKYAGNLITVADGKRAEEEPTTQVKFKDVPVGGRIKEYGKTWVVLETYGRGLIVEYTGIKGTSIINSRCCFTDPDEGITLDTEVPFLN